MEVILLYLKHIPVAFRLLMKRSVYTCSFWIIDLLSYSYRVQQWFGLEAEVVPGDPAGAGECLPERHPHWHQQHQHHPCPQESEDKGEGKGGGGVSERGGEGRGVK